MDAGFGDEAGTRRSPPAPTPGPTRGRDRDMNAGQTGAHDGVNSLANSRLTPRRAQPAIGPHIGPLIEELPARRSDGSATSTPMHLRFPPAASIEILSGFLQP